MTDPEFKRRPNGVRGEARGQNRRNAAPKRSLVSWIGVALRLVVAYRQATKSYEQKVEALRPQGLPDAPKRNVSSFVKQGRDADAPQQIPARGWWQVTKRVAQKFSENELMAEAAGCTFYALLSLFPAITAIVSIYGLFADRSNIETQLSSVAAFLPSGGIDIIRDQVHRLTQSRTSGLSVGAAIGLLTALWSANAGTKAMFSALNDVYGEREERGFVKVTATSLAFTAGGVTFLLLAIGAIVVLPIIFGAIGLDNAFGMVAAVGRWPVLILILISALAVLYRYGPSRRLARWRWVTWGGTIAAILWIALSVGFSWYVAHFGSYNKTYGSLGAIIGFMTWIWLSTTVLLVGAQINAELEAQTERDSTVGREKPVGSRGAAPADVVA